MVTRALSWLEKQSWGEGQKQPQPLSVPGHSTGSTRRAAGHILQTDLRDSQLLVLFSTGSGSAWGLLWASISSHPAPCAAPLGLLWDQPIPAQGWDPPWGDTAPLNPGLTHLCSPGAGPEQLWGWLPGCAGAGMWGHGMDVGPWEQPVPFPIPGPGLVPVPFPTPVPSSVPVPFSIPVPP